jgi:uncharacterized protein (TIGR02646 family)
MKQISKGKHPRYLEQHRLSGGNYAGLPTKDKEKLRKLLLTEQGHICCYCMKRIPQTLPQDQIDKNYPSCKIEHVLSQENHPDQELNYQNLLVACNGNHGQPRIMQTCDTYKGEKDLSFNPSNRARNIELSLKYLPNGEIHSDDPFIDNEFEVTLHLNTKDLRDIRAAYYKNIKVKIERIGSGYPKREIPKRLYEEEKQVLLTKMNGQFHQYCMVGVYLLNKKLARYA